MEIERKDKPKEDSIEFRDLKRGDTFIFASGCNYHSEDPIMYMKCEGAGDHYNYVRLSDGYASYIRGDLLVKKVNGKFVYSLEEGDN